MGKVKAIGIRITELYQEYQKIEGYLKNERRPGPLSAFRKQRTMLANKIRAEVAKINRAFTGNIVKVYYQVEGQDKSQYLVNIDPEEAELLVLMYAQAITNQEIKIKHIEEITLSPPQKL